MYARHLKYLLLFSPILFSACAPPRPAAEAPINEVIPVKERERKTAEVSSWVIKGAMAAKNAQKAWSASLNWRQQGINNYQIRLFGPLGGGTVIIEKKGGVITYRDGPKTASSTNGEALLKKHTGISLPVNKLYYWVRGLPAPGAVQSKKYDQYKHLTYLKQDGYSIQYSQFTSRNHVDLPSKIRLQGHGLTIKLVIKSWNT